MIKKSPLSKLYHFLQKAIWCTLLFFWGGLDADISSLKEGTENNGTCFSKKKHGKGRKYCFGGK